MASLQKRKRFGKPVRVPLLKKQRLLRHKSGSKKKTKKPNTATEATGGATTSKSVPRVDLPPDSEWDVGFDFSSPAVVFESLIAPVTLETFFSEYWEKKPLILRRLGAEGPRTQPQYTRLFNFASFQTLVKEHSIRFEQNVNVCRYVNAKRQSLNGKGKLTAEKLTKLWEEERATFQLHQPQQFKDVLWRVLTHLESYFGCLVGSNIYLTPGGAQGLAPHYDDVEVFILQLEGCKHWKLYAPTTELPQNYSRDLSQLEIGLPTHDFVLNTGDLLYFPRGTIHQANTPSQTPCSVHITISTYQQNAWGNFLSHVLHQSLHEALATDVSFRRGLPRNVVGENNSEGSGKSECLQTLKKQSERLLTQLTKYLDVSKALQSYSRDFIASRLPPYTETGQLGSPEGPLPSTDSVVELCWPDYTYMGGIQEEEGEGRERVTVYHSLSNSRETHMVARNEPEPVGVRLPSHYKDALEMLLTGSPVSVVSLPLPAEDRRNLVMTLWAEGLLRQHSN